MWRSQLSSPNVTVDSTEFSWQQCVTPLEYCEPTQLSLELSPGLGFSQYG